MKLNRKRLAQAGLGVVIAFGLLQLVQPTIEARPARAEMAMPVEVESVLRNSCFDCHSNETNLLWFDRIAPGSWLVARDVRRGRAVLNFSELGERPKGEQRARLFEAIEFMSAETMPPSQYRALHRAAVVSPAQLDIVRAFAKTLAEPSLQDRDIGMSLDRLAHRKVAPAPNGMAFPEDVATWAPIEISQRWDNGTVRLILGNSTATDAAKNERTNPWPDGSSIAKVAFKPGPETFVQIEIMAKASGTWNWARWVGPDLTPYGHDASFVAECQGCHEPMANHDYVYSLPNIQFDPAAGPIQSMRMSAGRVELTTPNRRLSWLQIDDPHWYGARISAGPSSSP